ncbi:hypothetical protein AFEL58S_02004 [Afipia felis]
MERAVTIWPDQKISSKDQNNMGLFARASMDHVVGDAIEPGKRFTGFPVTQSGPLEITVGTGRLYSLGRVFYRDDEGGVVLQLADYIPLVTKCIVTVAVWGQEVATAVEPRTFLKDASTRETYADAVATESRRHAEVNLVGGLEAVEPQPAGLDANVLAVAYVTLSPAGIVSIEAVEINRLPSVSKNATRIGGLESWRDGAGARIDTLASDLASLNARTRGMVTRRVMNDVIADVARIKDVLDLPQDIVSYYADHFLDTRGTDINHPDHLARIEEGIRFPAAQQSLAQILLLNQYDANVKMNGTFMLPAYNKVARIAVQGWDTEVSLAQYAYQTIQTEQLTVTRQRVRYGNSMDVCTNSAWWKSGQYNVGQGLFARAGENYEVVGMVGSLGVGHEIMRVRQYWVDTFEESYTETRVVTEAVSGHVSGQSFLNSQGGWLTDVRLPLTRVADTGDIHVLLCETTAGGPNYKRVIARATVAAADLKVMPVKTAVPIGPVHLSPGLYAVVWVTAGNHFMAQTIGNKYLEGSFFQSTDGAWFQGDLTKDVPIELVFAEFLSPRTEVQMMPITLENGIANIDILSEVIVPPGTEILHEVQINSVWRTIDGSARDLFAGLPALLPYRIVFVGTTDIQPGLTLGAASTVTAWRPRTDYRQVSPPTNLTTECDEVEIRVEVEGWDDARHDVNCKLLVGETYATTVTSSAVEERTLPDVAIAGELVTNRKEFRFTFHPAPAVSSIRVKIEGTTDNALVTYHVSCATGMGWAT